MPYVFYPTVSTSFSYTAFHGRDKFLFFLLPLNWTALYCSPKFTVMIVNTLGDFMVNCILSPCLCLNGFMLFEQFWAALKAHFAHLKKVGLTEFRLDG